MINIKSLSLLFCIIFLSSCAATEIEGRYTALKHTKILSSKTKLGEGVHVVYASVLPRHHYNIKQAILLNAANITLKKGYKRFVLLRDDKNDTQLLEAIKNNTVRELCLRRIKNRSPLVNRTKVLGRYRTYRSIPGIKYPEEYFTTAVVVMFKDKKIGKDAAKLKEKLTVLIASQEKENIKKHEEKLKKKHPLVRQLIYQ